MQLSYCIESPLPPPDHPLDAGAGSPMGRGAALVLEGWAYCPDAEIESLAIQIDDGGPSELPVTQWRNARRDVMARTAANGDPAARKRALLSGFWVIVPIAPGDHDRRITLRLLARIKGGGVLFSKSHDVFVAGTNSSPQAGPSLFTPVSADPRICICMATYNPAPEAFRRQVESIRFQTHKNWICMVQDDASNPRALLAIREILAGDPRLILQCNDRNLGFYHNFERALARVPADCELVCLCDQDDRWNAGKLETLIGGFSNPRTVLVYSDMRIVDERGSVLSNTYWTMRRNNFRDLETLFFANTVTGAASMFKAALLPLVLPFPPKIGDAFHDWWIALVALATGRIEYLDRPLYDYFQHAENALGWCSQISSPISGWQLLRSPAYRKKMAQRAWDMYRVTGKFLAASIAILQKRASDSPHADAIARLAQINRRPLRALFGQMVRSAIFRRASESQERNMFLAFLTNRLISFYFARLVRGRLSAPTEAEIESLAPRIARRELPVDRLEKQIAPLNLSPRPEAPIRLNMLLPAMDWNYVFGGYLAKFHWARRVAQAGVRVRLVVTEAWKFDPETWRKNLAGIPGLADLLDRVEIADQTDRHIPLEVNPLDRFMPTTCWTAYIADAAARQLSSGPILSLIQEYEPLLAPSGSERALAQAAYDLDHFAIFSTELLRGYFRIHHAGVYRRGSECGDRNSIVFSNAIAACGEEHIQALARRNTIPGEKKKFLFYARPEQHAQRNMFELGILALRRAMREGALDPREWVFEGIGTIGEPFTVPLPGATMHVRQRMEMQRYAEYLPGFDAGMALMDTPHPSLVPLEMAAAGLITVTNSFENKTAEALAVIASNFEVAEPGIESLAGALQRAQERAGDFSARAAGACVNWPRNWEQALADQVIAPVLGALEMAPPAQTRP